MLSYKALTHAIAIVSLLAASVVAWDAQAATGDKCAPPKRKPPPTVPVKPPAAYIVEVWGDSIALAEVPHLAAHLKGSTVINRAAHGATIWHYAGHQEGTQVLVIAVGTNDAETIGADAYMQALADAVVMAQVQGVRVVLVTPQRPRSDYPVDVTMHLQAVRDVAKLTGATLADRYAVVGTLLRDQRLSTQVLPTARAADLSARAIAKAVQS